MADGSGSANSNSWTILTQEETAALSHRPVVEGTEHCDDGDTSPAEHTGRGAENLPAEGAVSVAQGHTMEAQQAPQENTAEQDGDASPAGPVNAPTATPTSATDVPPSTLDVEGHSLPDSDAHSPAELGPDHDSFSDSYSHISLTPEGPPATLLTAETLGRTELTQEEERLVHGGPHRQNGEGLESIGEESELTPRVSDFGKQAESLVGSEAGTGVTEAEGEPELRKRSLLGTLERIGRREEDEETEEEFQLNRREEESGLSLNKCILGAVILLGLGTIFFSESDYGARDPRDTETPVKQDWLNPEISQQPVDVASTELLNKLAKENQQIGVLQAQLQVQQEELKVAKGRATEGAVERLRREEVEKENGRLKQEMASLPVLLKENEKMKRELESVRALQKELETLRATVTGLKLSTVDEAASPPLTSTVSPPSGQPEDSKQATAAASEPTAKKAWEGEKMEEEKKKKKKEWKKEETKARNKVELKGEKMESKDRGKWNKESDKEGKGWKQSEEKRERGEWKKEKTGRGDEGKPWKDRDGNKDRKEKNERKDWKEGKQEKRNDGKEWRGKEGKQEKQNDGKEWRGKEGKQEKQNDGKEWRGKEGKQEKRNDGKEWRGREEKREKRNDGKEWRGREEKRERHGDWHQDKEERKKERDSGKESGKDKRDWRQKGEKEEWKKDGEGRDESKPWGKRDGWKEDRKDGEWKKDRGHSHKHADKHVHNKHDHHHSDHEEHLWRGPGDGKPPLDARGLHPAEQQEYWPHQRTRLQRNPGPPRPCDSAESCARAEGLLPVPRAEFEAVLGGYLAKAEEAGADPAASRELRSLAAQFFDNDVFVHDRMSFQEFADDLGDILEDMVEGLGEEGAEQDALEEEMDNFDKEITKRFSMPGAGGEKEERKKGEWKKESGRARG